MQTTESNSRKLMNYKNIHDAIISRARNRVLEGYSEKHHIIPVCIGGADDLNNIAILTLKEHRIVHWCLSKIYPEHKKLKHAAYLMTGRRYNFWLGEKHSEETKQKIADWMTGRKASKETKKKMSEASSGKNNPFYGKTLSQEHKMKIAKSAAARPKWKHSEETKRKIALARLGNKYPRQIAVN